MVACCIHFWFKNTTKMKNANVLRSQNKTHVHVKNRETRVSECVYIEKYDKTKQRAKPTRTMQTHKAQYKKRN